MQEREGGFTLSDPRIDHVKREILAVGTDDWGNIADVVGFARETLYGDRVDEGFPEDGSLPIEQLADARDEWTSRQEREALPIGIAAVKELVREGLVWVGEIVGGKFTPWSGAPEDIDKRIDAAVEKAEFPLLPGHLFWLNNTPEGAARGHDVLAEGDRCTDDMS